LEALLEHELTKREARRIDRYRAEACLSPDKHLSSIDFAAVPSLSKPQVMALAEGHEGWIARQTPLCSARQLSSTREVVA